MGTHIARLRPPGALARLRDTALRRATHPFAWGTSDCVTWAADAVWALTGRDPMADLRGAYFSARGAARVCIAHGGMPAMLDARLPAGRIAAAWAIDGDVCLLRADAHERSLPELGALGVLWRGSLVVQGAAGLVVDDVAMAAQWWRVAP